MRGWTICSAALLLAAAHGGAEPVQTWRAFPDPTRFEAAIRGFEAADSLAPPPAGAVVCVGSSSMRGWHHRIAADLAPLTVIKRGFGGSTVFDVLHYADRVVLAYAPRAVLLYEGDNDVAAGIPVAQIEATYAALVARLRGAQPDLRIYLMSAKPSPSRWHLWPQMADLNRRLAALSAADPKLIYVDVATPMLGADGEPRPEIFKEDRLHMTDAGYDLWAAAVAPVLVPAETPYEETPE